MDRLDDALIRTQKLAKKLRQLRNQGQATDAQLDLAERALDQLRQVARLRGEPAIDLDSRAERDRAKQARATRAREDQS